MAGEQFSLCWDNFHNNMSSGLASLYKSEDLVDVTLAAEGRYLKAHKMVLSVCSPYFRELFQVNPCKHPIVFLKDVSYQALSNLLEFMYQGEVKVSQDELGTFIKTAEALKIKGLTGDNANSNETDTAPQNNVSSSEETSTVRKAREREKSPPVRKKPMGPASKRLKVDNESSSPIPQSQSTPVQSQSTNEIKQTNVEQQIMHFKMEPEETAVSLANEEDVTYDDSAMDEMGIDNSTDYLMESTTEMDVKAGTSAAMDNVEATGDNQGRHVVAVMKGPRGGPQLLVRGYLFTRKVTCGTTTHWNCISNKSHYCRARCVTKGNGVILQYSDHSHEPPSNQKLQKSVILHTKKFMMNSKKIK